MPKPFEDCVKNKGKVRRVSGPDKEHGLAKGEYVNYCVLNGKSYRGEVRKMEKKASFKIKKVISRVELGSEFAQFAKKKAPTSEIEVLTEGYWEHPQYGVVEITPNDIDKFVTNFNNGTRKIDIAVDQDHNPELGAAGWFKELKKVVEGGITKLKAVVEWTDMGADLLSKGIYKYFSPEFDFEYEDFETHEEFENVLLGGGLTNRPYFKSLAPVQLSENIFAGFTDSSINNSNKKGGEKIMTKEEILAKLKEDSSFKLSEEASEEEKGAFDEATEELNADSSDDKSDDKSDGDDKSDDKSDDKAEDKEEGDDGADDKDEGDVKASEIRRAKEFNDMKSKLGVVEKKLQYKEVKEEVQGYTFSESNPKGKLLPKSNEATQALLMSLNVRQSKLFTDFLDSMPSLSTVMFEESGSDKDESTKASEQLVKQATELSKKEGITFGEALKKVSADNPELTKKMSEE